MVLKGGTYIFLQNGYLHPYHVHQFSSYNHFALTFFPLLGSLCYHGHQFYWWYCKQSEKVNRVVILPCNMWSDISTGLCSCFSGRKSPEQSKAMVAFLSKTCIIVIILETRACSSVDQSTWLRTTESGVRIPPSPLSSMLKLLWWLLF
jgi:hypothetical protein